MKKITYACLAALTLLGMTSCVNSKGLIGQTLPSTTTTPSANSGSSQGGLLGGSTASSALGNLLSGLIGNNTKVTMKTLEGTWQYASPDCRFESESYLAKAGGEVAAATVEEKLTELYGKVGIKPGTCSFTFAPDNSCVINLGGRQVAGTYTLNPDTRDLVITAGAGLIKLNAKVYYDFSQLTVLFQADKLLQYVQMIAAFTGQANSTIGALASMLQNYDGMMIGMNLRK